jgi:LAGLIDADG DNA endonuclease family
VSWVKTLKLKKNKSIKTNKINLNNTCIMNTDEIATLGPLLPMVLKSVFIGIMLGDGSLHRSSPTSNVRFEFSFGQKYELFALYLGDLFKEFMSNPVKTLEIKGKTKTYSNYRLKTKSLPLFVPYYNMFYSYNEDLNKYIKIVS